MTVQGILSHKEKLPTGLVSDLAYSYECIACCATYTGQSKQSFQTMAGNHLLVSARTGSLLVRSTQLTISDRIEICGSNRSANNLKCIRSFSCRILLKIYEALEIPFKKPSPNQDGIPYPLSFCRCSYQFYFILFYFNHFFLYKSISVCSTLYMYYPFYLRPDDINMNQ